MNYSYKESFNIKCYEVDALKNYKAFSFMNAAQEIAHIQSTKIGSGYDQLIQSNNVWVISRAHVKFIKAPKWEEIVTLETWAKREDGLFAIRDFELTDSKGEIMIQATTSWIVMNMETRRVQRLDHMFDSQARSKYFDKNAIEEPCSKIIAPQSADYLWDREVRISDIDYNLHANNAKYIEWAMDTIDIDTLKSYALDEYRISFNMEARLHDSVEIYQNKLSAKEFYIEGKKDGKSVFQIIFKFK